MKYKTKKVAEKLIMVKKKIIILQFFNYHFYLNLVKEEVSHYKRKVSGFEICIRSPHTLSYTKRQKKKLRCSEIYRQE